MQEFKLSIAEIAAHPGVGREVSIEAPIEGVQTSLIGLRPGSNVSAALWVDGVVEGIVVSGTVSGEIDAQCVRCVTPVRSRLTVDVAELFVMPGSESSDEQDVYRIEGREIDIEPMVRDALVLALPLNPLCREDCKGLCAHCGRNRNEGDCDCTEEEFDPRWAALDEVRARLEAG